MARRSVRLPAYTERRRRRATNRSELEEGLALQFRAMGVTGYVREYRFAAEHVGMGPGVLNRLRAAGLRDWKFDFAWPLLSFAVEVDGGTWVQGGHNTGEGSTRDMNKQHQALSLGWRLYRCNGELVKSGAAALLIQRLVNEESRRRCSVQALLDSWGSRARGQQANAGERGDGARMVVHGADCILRCREELERLLDQGLLGGVIGAGS